MYLLTLYLCQNLSKNNCYMINFYIKKMLIRLSSKDISSTHTQTPYLYIHTPLYRECFSLYIFIYLLNIILYFNRLMISNELKVISNTKQIKQVNCYCIKSFK